MAPAVFLVILGLAVVSASKSSDPSLGAEQQEQPIENQQNNEGFRRELWEEFMKKVELYNKKNGKNSDSVQAETEDADDLENDQNDGGFNLEMDDFDDLNDSEFKNIMDKLLFPMFGEEETTEAQPTDEAPKFEGLAGKGAPVQNQ
ncbi:cathepsin J-like isoform X2 [Mesocricetus auratus]|nr:cathepsin J-like isoform X2 [Mesocricetus auratus]